MCRLTVGAPSHFKVYFLLLAGGLGLLTLQCKTEMGIDPYSVQYGVWPGRANLDVHSVHLDSAQFSDGKYRYFLEGRFSNGSEKGTFTLCTEGNPEAFGASILSQHISIGTDKSSPYECLLYRAEKDVVIEWKRETDLIRIVVPPTSGH